MFLSNTEKIEGKKIAVENIKDVVKKVLPANMWKSGMLNSDS